MVGNLVLWQRVSGAVKRDFRTYIRRYTSRNKNFECGHSHSNALLQFYLNFESYMPHKASCHLTRCEVINEVKLLPTVYRRIYCCIFLKLSNQTSRYNSKCIRMRYIYSCLAFLPCITFLTLWMLGNFSSFCHLLSFFQN